MKDIKGYEGIYKASKEGKIFSCPKDKGRWKKSRFLKPWLIGNGYEMVMLYKNGKAKKFLVHRLIAQTFIPNKNNQPEVDHKNGNRLDNRSCNLEWVSSHKNKLRAWDLHLYDNLVGSKHHLSKLNESDIAQIREMVNVQGITQKKISEQFNVSPMTISLIISRKTWKHVI